MTTAHLKGPVGRTLNLNLGREVRKRDKQSGGNLHKSVLKKINVKSFKLFSCFLVVFFNEGKGCGFN